MTAVISYGFLNVEYESVSQIIYKIIYNWYITVSDWSKMDFFPWKYKKSINGKKTYVMALNINEISVQISNFYTKNVKVFDILNLQTWNHIG